MAGLNSILNRDRPFGMSAPVRFEGVELQVTPSSRSTLSARASSPLPAAQFSHASTNTTKTSSSCSTGRRRCTSMRCASSGSAARSRSRRRSAGASRPRAPCALLYETPVSHVASASGRVARTGATFICASRSPTSDGSAEAAPFAWSRYALEQTGDSADLPSDSRHHRQDVTSATSAGTATSSSRSGCTCRAACRFTTHPVVRSNAATSSSGNRRCRPDARASRSPSKCAWRPESILIRTLTLFAITIVLALATFALAIWWVVRRGRTKSVCANERLRHARSQGSDPRCRTPVKTLSSEPRDSVNGRGRADLSRTPTCEPLRPSSARS